jgi:CheY-like chemotaxis protein
MSKILIVEDEAFSVALLARALKGAQHVVLTAVDGSDGIAKANADPPDLIIMDMSMPKMSGFEAIRQLKASTATSAIPIIALTSANTAEDRQEAYEGGCDAYESKPVDIPRLLAHVKELTSQ